MSKILFICTSNKDRSPALLEYFSATYPQHEFRSAGVNKYLTGKHGTHYLTEDDINWAELIVYAEQIHWNIADRDFKKAKAGYKDCIILNLGEYRQGCIGDDYLLRADEKLRKHLAAKT